MRKDPVVYANNLKEDLIYCRGNELELPFTKPIKIEEAETSFLNLIEELKRTPKVPEALVREVTLTESAHETAELIFDRNYDY